VLRLLQKGNKRRTVEPTAANKTSSRSHALLRVSIRQSSRDPSNLSSSRNRVGKLFMVDLAGSERASNTKNTGIRLKEGAHINRSLLALGNVINALGMRNPKYVNFRDSKLTRMLKEALSGNCKTVMVAHISPASAHYDESRNTLVYAERARNITNKVRINMVDVSHHVKQYQSIITELRQEIQKLQDRIEENDASKEESSTPVSSPEATHKGINNAEENGDNNAVVEQSAVNERNQQNEKADMDREIRQMRAALVDSFNKQMEVRRKMMEIDNCLLALSTDLEKLSIVINQWETEKVKFEVADNQADEEPDYVRQAWEDIEYIQGEQQRFLALREDVEKEFEDARDRTYKLTEPNSVLGLRPLGSSESMWDLSPMEPLREEEDRSEQHGVPSSSQSDNVTVRHLVRGHGDAGALVGRVAGAPAHRGTLSEPATPGGRLLSQLPPVEVRRYIGSINGGGPLSSSMGNGSGFERRLHASFSDEVGKLFSSKQCVYCGFDPTSDSLHVGNLLAIVLMIHMQRMGHDVIAVIGDSTAQIGDPSGRLTERDKMADDAIERNVAGIRDNLETIFINHEEHFWKDDTSKPTGELGLLRVQQRIRSGEGISFTEFSYQMFQSYDWLYLHDKYKCRFQVRAETTSRGRRDRREQSLRRPRKNGEAFVCYGILVPLITAETGDKYGKSAGNAVWLNPRKTSPYELYQTPTIVAVFMRLTDTEAVKFLRLFTFAEQTELDNLIEAQMKSPERRVAQKRLAQDITLLVHGERGLSLAQNATEILFGGSRADETLHRLDEEELRLIFGDAGFVQLAPDPGTTVLDMAMKARLFPSEEDAVRIISAGGFYINQHRVNAPSHVIVPGVHVLPNNLTLARVALMVRLHLRRNPLPREQIRSRLRQLFS
ncbi:hypothetical protein HPB47_005436, partial [Ixodes persulcatus]